MQTEIQHTYTHNMDANRNTAHIHTQYGCKQKYSTHTHTHKMDANKNTAHTHNIDANRNRDKLIGESWLAIR